MATKTITLEIDAYDKLRRAKRGRESFSSVVRRATFTPELSTGESILEDATRLMSSRDGVKNTQEEYWKKVAAFEAESHVPSPSPWDDQK
ncbi:MAG: antitoxin VapB family protein [Verrucomicrobiota bacterium]